MTRRAACETCGLASSPGLAVKRTSRPGEARTSPGDRHEQPVSESVRVEKLLVPRPVLVEQPGELDVVTAILGDLEQLPLLEPTDGLHAVRCLFHTQRGRRDRIE